MNIVLAKFSHKIGLGKGPTPATPINTRYYFIFNSLQNINRFIFSGKQGSFTENSTTWREKTMEI
jgi:hypothetical protein